MILILSGVLKKKRTVTYLVLWISISKTGRLIMPGSYEVSKHLKTGFISTYNILAYTLLICISNIFVLEAGEVDQQFRIFFALAED